MNPLGLKMIGRWGNQLFQYAHARALAEQQGRELHTQPWIGQQIFQIDDPPLDGSEEVLPEAYHQDQASLIYSRADCRRWFAWRPEVYRELNCLRTPEFAAAHIRRGDYAPLGYPVVNESAVLRAASQLGFGCRRIDFVSEESPTVFSLEHGPAFLADFYRLAAAPVLFRSNSSFSWWAATLGNGRVFSPVIEGLKGGMEHDNVPFVEGNHPRFCELEFVTDLYLRET